MINYKLVKSDEAPQCLKNLYDIVSFLRDPEDGCPWDNEQMPKDIIRSMQGEIYEYIDALTDGDKAHQSEELGDVFLNLFLLAKIHDQNGDFRLSDSINDACEKYIRRHPHVFSDVNVLNSDEVLANWGKIKKEVEGRCENPQDFFSNIERNSPELERCYKISKKAAKVGFEWPDIDGVYEKINEEINEVKKAENKDELEEELGDLLFSVVNLCRWYKIKPQDALHFANAKFIKRFNLVYRLAAQTGKELEKLTDVQWNEFWETAKSDTKQIV